jgi:DNA-binding CsgD family transcriptional regulator
MVVQGATPHLTPREKEVLDLLCQGWTDQEIGASLGIGGDTVRTYVGQLREKLGARTRVQLGRLAPPPTS